MSSRPFIKPHPVITNGDMSSATLTSLVTIIQMPSAVSYSIDWTGVPVGTFAVQVSNDYSVDASGAVLNAGTWTSLSLSSSISAAGSADNAFADITITAAYAIRLKYTKTSGTGVLNATVNAKVY